MAAVTLTPADLAPFAAIEVVKAQAMIDDALALAIQFAPCIATDAFVFAAAAKAIIRGAVIRWNESGSGAMSSQTAGPFAVALDTRQVRRGMYLPSEVEQLKALCAGPESSGVFAVDTISTLLAVTHADICSIFLGSPWCSCGAVLTGSLPLYESGW